MANPSIEDHFENFRAMLATSGFEGAEQCLDVLESMTEEQVRVVQEALEYGLDVGFAEGTGRSNE